MLSNLPPAHVRHATNDLPLSPDLALIDALQRIKYHAHSQAEAQAIATDALSGPVAAATQQEGVFVSPLQAALSDAMEALRQIASLESYAPEAGQIARAVLEKLAGTFW